MDAMAADISHFEDHLARELPLHAELPPDVVRVHAVGVDEGDGVTEERGGAFRGIPTAAGQWELDWTA